MRSTENPVWSTDVQAAIQSAAHRELDVLEAEAREAGVVLRTHLEEGRPSLAVAECAKRLAAELLVVGASGRSGLKHVLLGGVAERLIRVAACPVVTVPLRSGAPGWPLPGRIVVGVDFSPASKRAVELARRLAPSLGGCELLLLHVHEVESGLASALAASAGESLVEPFERKRELPPEAEHRAVLREWTRELERGGLAVSWRELVGAPAPSLAGFARAWGAALVVLGTHGLSGWAAALLGSDARRLLHDAPCPVLTLR